VRRVRSRCRAGHRCERLSRANSPGPDPSVTLLASSTDPLPRCMDRSGQLGAAARERMREPGGDLAPGAVAVVSMRPISPGTGNRRSLGAIQRSHRARPQPRPSPLHPASALGRVPRDRHGHRTAHASQEASPASRHHRSLVSLTEEPSWLRAPDAARRPRGRKRLRRARRSHQRANRLASTGDHPRSGAIRGATVERVRRERADTHAPPSRGVIAAWRWTRRGACRDAAVRLGRYDEWRLPVPRGSMQEASGQPSRLVFARVFLPFCVVARRAGTVILLAFCEVARQSGSGNVPDRAAGLVYDQMRLRLDPWRAQQSQLRP
jgi:hypothetical protein